MIRNNSVLTDKELGDQFRQKRQKRGYSQSWCAAELKISTAYLNQLENGKRRWRSTLAEAYEQLLAK